jgi:hypothetical protein
VPLTSKDVAFTYRALLDPRNPVPEVQPYRIIRNLRRRMVRPQLRPMFGRAVTPAL